MNFRSILPQLGLFLATAVLLAVSGEAQARINLVTLPDRDSVQLTIYNSVDLTLVRERRNLTFRKGLNRLEFSWANTLIDPTSVEFRAVTQADGVEVLDVSFPPRVANTLEWRIQSEVDGEVQVEIRYFTSGIRWSADYVVEASRAEDLMGLAGYVRVFNQSGEDYQNAQIRLVVGNVRLVEQIAQLARDRSGAKAANAPMTDMLREQNDGELYKAFGAVAAKAESKSIKEVVKEGLSEYFLYTVDGRESVLNGWSRRLRSFQTNDVPLTSYYKYEKEHWGDQVVRFYKFKNDTQSRLGREPLPDGMVKAFRLLNDERFYGFVGRTAVKYIPVNEEVEMEMGPDLEVMIRPVLMDWQKTELRFDGHGNVVGWTIKEQWKIDLQNSKEIPVTADVRRSFQGDWNLTSAASYEKVDASKVKFVVPLKPREQKTVTYETTVRHGTSASR